MSTIIPKGYKPSVAPEDMEQAIKEIKLKFQDELLQALNLIRVTAPLFVLSGTGINDNLNGVERPVSFEIPAVGGKKAEIVHSLAKWKRMKLGAYGIEPGKGLYTDMNAIRADEELDNLHSLYVDQWDWERTITATDRNLDFLKEIVRKIYQALRNTESSISNSYPHIKPILPTEITFIHSEDLQVEYPSLSSKERENKAAKKYGAIFIIGIGGELADGKIHDGRSPDYDDWSTPTSDKYKGLNGDIIVWNPVLESAFEISSMGIRVDKTALVLQLKIRGCEDRKELLFHKSLLEDKIPLSIGGGIGQSRLCMFLLRCVHIGEVQVSIWPEEMQKLCAENNIILK
ncbi:MAG: aspartate--ammonia ligase [Dysgonamonadaceae bacterium]|jgi:aspartate--ammonia ligase|nr:aspartate--ammonia ligase [Dysgonamonadaceae bacterium]MDD3308674.1 aspartate--ammonia ligase [Dysgonamonadaceae bacterium]MDD3899734.1 aspartate--ammonia ligase [Dysgonamonadaceae bacterium]MDD4397987.1 aspartate--ammonia ligase [Dysgonamonadaceae bacterium]MEA5081644.1 aspartate--ammonia ligase [Dysgonamonadaceae bacterium]